MTRYSKRYKYQKSKSKFNHRLYISPNSYYDVVFATKYNLWLNQLAVFCCIQKMCQDAKKLAAFRHPHKIAPRFDHWLYFGFWARWMTLIKP